jgi:uncharacterized membrane protein YdjX (TVP38/TMEM64 family)
MRTVMRPSQAERRAPSPLPSKVAHLPVPDPLQWDGLPQPPEKTDSLARRARPVLIALACFGIGGWLLAQGLRPDSPARDMLRTLLEDVRHPYWGILYVLLAYAFGTLVFAPITALFVATCLAVDTIHGIVYCLIGGLFSASLAYLAGRLLGARWAGRLRHPALDKLRSQVATRPVRSVVIARFLPVGNFTLINFALGSFRVPYGAFLLGNVVGIAPGLLAITVFKELLEHALYASDWKHPVVLAAGALLAVGMLYAVSRRLTLRRALQTDGDEEPTVSDEPTPR